MQKKKTFSKSGSDTSFLELIFYPCNGLKDCNNQPRCYKNGGVCSNTSDKKYCIIGGKEQKFYKRIYEKSKN